MNSTIQRLFETYGESVLKEMSPFPHEELVGLLSALPMEERRRIEIYDQISQYHYLWAADAFAVGLRLGLSLLHNDIRCPCPEQV